ncbi:hypothetical protein GFY24_06940 [Nocardia sp. SYP-A9097]|uniref:hypothetical protein n=1 Tax=Nocardia sp. SYP-A9097 TaxID=2663237 RepID=UPI00129AE156|nr:hypothetical protein [Nocardia sp. SYP-A9097]MRH87199.1 hypothetical protein [Nocardia sp. SYP-A9097]
MIFDVGPFVFVVPVPRLHSGLFAVAFLGMLGLTVFVIMVISASCGAYEKSIEPGSVPPTQTQVAIQCAPICLPATDTNRTSSPLGPYEE